MASFCGTGNNPQFLIDRTGNRRWVAAEVISIDNPYLNPFNYVGIFSQAYALWKGGTFKYWLDDDEIVELNERNREFEVPNLEEELILTYFRLPFKGCNGVFLSVAEILERVNAGIRQPISPTAIGIALRKLGFISTRYKGVRGYVIIERSLEEIQASRKNNATDVWDLLND